MDKSENILQIITGILAVLHLGIVANGFYQGALSFMNLNDILFIVLWLIFIAGFALSWKRMKMAGMVLMIWNAALWILDLYLIGDGSDSDSGAMSMAFSPVLVLGAFFVLEWYKTSGTGVPTKKQQWRFILRILLINYAVLYAILVFAELSGTTGANQVDYLSLPFILNPLLLVIFIFGFVLSWKREALAGIVFLIWCAVLIYEFFGFPGTSYSGPWAFCALPILVQGILYLINHMKFRSVEILN